MKVSLCPGLCSENVVRSLLQWNGQWPPFSAARMTSRSSRAKTILSMPYHRRRRASLAVTPISIQNPAEADDGSSTTRSDSSVSSVPSDATYFEADIAKYGRIPEILMDELWNNDSRVVCGALRELADVGSSDGEEDEDIEAAVDDRSWVYELGGPSYIVSVMKKWHRYRKITIEGLRAIANLGANSDFRDAIFTCGGVEVTMAAMKNFKEDPVVQRNACACIRRLCLDKKQNCVDFVNVSKGMKYVVRAMKRCQANDQLQKFAIDLLYDFCSLEQLRFPIVSSGSLVPLNAAIDRFGKSKDDNPAHFELWEKARVIINLVIE